MPVRLRKKPHVPKAKARQVQFIGGPYPCRFLHMTDQDHTLSFSANGMSGRYIRDVGKCNNREIKMKWEKA